VGSVLEPSLERILALRPDLVCTATTANSEETTRTLERLGLPVYVSSDSALVDIERDLERLGEAVGHGDEGRRARQQFHDALEALRRPPASPPVRLLVVVWPDPLVAAGAASPVGELLALLGATNAADEAAAARTPYPTIDLERLLVRPPSLIVLGTHGREAPPLGSLERMLGPRRRIERLDGDLLFRPGPRLIEGARALAALLPTAGTSLPPKGTP
jgi:iron complex transport system substrate-binding protein